MTTKEVALYLGVRPGYVARLCKKGVLVATRFGRAWVIDPASVEAYKNAPKDKGGRPRKRQV